MIALSIGVNKKSKIRVGSSILKVRQVVSPTLIVVGLDDGPDLTVTDQQSTELMPGVTVFAGVGGRKRSIAPGSRDVVRLAFEADRSVEIRVLED